MWNFKSEKKFENYRNEFDSPILCTTSFPYNSLTLDLNYTTQHYAAWAESAFPKTAESLPKEGWEERKKKIIP